MITHRNKEIKKPSMPVSLFYHYYQGIPLQFASTCFHLHLHGSAPLKGLATPDY